MRGLFISYMKGFSKDLQKYTPGLDQIPHQTCDKCPHHLIHISAAKPHEVRAMSASLAWRANIGFQDILSAAMLVWPYNFYFLLFERHFHHQRWTPFFGTSVCSSESRFPVDQFSPLFPFSSTVYILALSENHLRGLTPYTSYGGEDSEFFPCGSFFLSRGSSLWVGLGPVMLRRSGFSEEYLIAEYALQWT